MEAEADHIDSHQDTGVAHGYTTQQTAADHGATADIVDDDVLLDTYETAYEEDPAMYQRAFAAYEEDQYDVAHADPSVDENAIVARRAPFTYLAKPKEAVSPKRDPALRDNPLRGRLIGLLTTTAALLLVFFQSLVYNIQRTGYPYASVSENGMFGPDGMTLYELGGLNSNAVRNAGGTYRIFWAAWMHSGWLHISFNLLCQIQFFFMFEPDWGFWRSFLAYFIAGVVGNLVSAVADPCTTTVGSSGGLFGLMGAMIPYCIEYWKTIPRPGCIIVFSLIVISISILVGFTGKTDNWAHMGGLLGGILFTFATITALTAFNKTELKASPSQHELPSPLAKKKVIHRSYAARKFQQKTYPKCQCGRREWIIRLSSTVSMIIVLIMLLYVNYEFQPVGHVSFSNTSECRCCYLNLEAQRDPRAAGAKWYCFATTATPEDWNLTWGEFCDLSVPEISRLDPKPPYIDPIGRRVDA